VLQGAIDSWTHTGKSHLAPPLHFFIYDQLPLVVLWFHSSMYF
jgi:hypothetical protein